MCQVVSMATDFTQARIRVNKDGGLEALEAIYQREAFLLDARDAVGTNKEARLAINKRLVSLRRVMSEIERTVNEQGWSEAKHDEHQHSV